MHVVRTSVLRVSWITQFPVAVLWSPETLLAITLSLDFGYLSLLCMCVRPRLFLTAPSHFHPLPMTALIMQVSYIPNPETSVINVTTWAYRKVTDSEDGGGWTDEQAAINYKEKFIVRVVCCTYDILP
jgi:hypothetical protein